MPTLTTGQPGDVQVNVTPDAVSSYDTPTIPYGFDGPESAAQRGTSFHPAYTIRTRYRTRTGLALMPSAGPYTTSPTLSTTVPNPAFLAAQPPADFGPGPPNPVNNYYGFAPAQAVRLHQPYTVKTVTWQAERVGQPPVCPHWDPQVAVGGNPVTNADGTARQNANEFLIDRWVSAPSSRPTPDGQGFVFRMSGRYVYGLLYPVEDGDTVWFGALPTQTVPPELLTINGLVFDRSILRSLPPQSATVPGAVVAAVRPEG